MGWPQVTEGERLAKGAADAKAALDAWIVQQRQAGRSFRDIAREVGMTPGGVQYVTRKR